MEFMPSKLQGPEAWRTYDPNAPATPEVIKALRDMRIRAGIDPEAYPSTRTPEAAPARPVTQRGAYIDQQVDK